MKFGTPVEQSRPFNRDYFHDNWCPICDFMGLWIFWKKDVVALSFVKFDLSSKNFRQKNIISIKELWYWIWRKSIEAFKFFQILNFLRIFSKLSNSGKFRFIELKFCGYMHLYWVMFYTKFYKNRWRPLNFRRLWFFYFFLSWHQIIKIRCIHKAFSVRKPKLSNVLSQKKNFVKSVRKQYGNLDSHPFLLVFENALNSRTSPIKSLIQSEL